LASVAGAAIPLPYGGKVRQVRADLKQQALHTYGISANDVVNALSIQNLIPRWEPRKWARSNTR
jgi:multidrug efflux pump subunit AcrB